MEHSFHYTRKLRCQNQKQKLCLNQETRILVAIPMLLQQELVHRFQYLLGKHMSSQQLPAQTPEKLLITRCNERDNLRVHSRREE